MMDTKVNDALLYCGLFMVGCAIQPQSDEQSAEAADGTRIIHLDGEWNIKTADTSLEGSGKFHPQANFGATCKDVTLSWTAFPLFERAELAANCKNTSGNWIASNVDLNLCITNSQGNLRFAHNGHFQDTCDSDIFVGDLILGAVCLTPHLDPVVTSIDLNQGISNRNGYLTCD